MEQSLARYFFNPESPRRERIDKVLLAMSDGPEFPGELAAFASSIMDKHRVRLEDRSTVLLVLFRTLFNRYYELKPSLFGPKTESWRFLCQAHDMSMLEATNFSIPVDVIPATEHHTTMGTLFAGKPAFRMASEAFSVAVFEPNPVDQLYRVHLSLAAIQRAAIDQRTAAGLSTPGGLLPLDDLFALFCGVLMAADIRDGFYLHWSIRVFAPRNGLSPALEYAAVNLEALVSHVNRYRKDPPNQAAYDELVR
jgi:hypothetical protein